MPTDEEYLHIAEIYKSGGIAVENKLRHMIYEEAKKSAFTIPATHFTSDIFTVFDQLKIGKNDSGWYGRGFYFTEGFLKNTQNSHNSWMPKGHNLYPLHVYLKILNPQHLRTGQRKYGAEIPKDFDGVIVTNPMNGIREEIVVRYSNQIKSADSVTYDDQGNIIPLSRRFNDSTDDIRESAIPSFKNYFSSFLSSF